MLSILRLRNLWITSLITAKPTHRPAPSLTVAQSRMLRLAPDGLIVTVLGLVGGAPGGETARRRFIGGGRVLFLSYSVPRFQAQVQR